MNNTIQKLMAEKAVIEAKIRKERVIYVRAFYADRIKAREADAVLTNMVVEMERRLSMVAYNHQEFDELLDDIETRLGYN